MNSWNIFFNKNNYSLLKSPNNPVTMTFSSVLIIVSKYHFLLKEVRSRSRDDYLYWERVLRRWIWRMTINKKKKVIKTTAIIYKGIRKSEETHTGQNCIIFNNNNNCDVLYHSTLIMSLHLQWFRNKINLSVHF